MCPGFTSPRYVNKKCCDEAGHIDNFEDVDRDDEIAFGLEGVKRLLHTWATENNLTYEIISGSGMSGNIFLFYRAFVQID